MLWAWLFWQCVCLSFRSSPTHISYPGRNWQKKCFKILLLVNNQFKLRNCVKYCLANLRTIFLDPPPRFTGKIHQTVVDSPSPIQEGLAIKAERMKKKLTGGKKKVEIDEIKVKNFVLLQLLVDINI